MAHALAPIRPLPRWLVAAAVALASIALYAPGASAADRAERLRIRQRTSSVYVTIPCRSCTDETFAVTARAVVRHCTPGRRYFFEMSLEQDGNQLVQTEDPLGSSEGWLCEDGSPVETGDEFASLPHAPMRFGEAYATATLYEIRDGSFIEVAAASGFVTIPDTK